MIENEDILMALAGEGKLSGILLVGDISYRISSMSVAKSTIPVRKPTTRGGVYFTDTTAYKVRAVTQDMSITAEIPKLMLGPSADFKPVVVMVEAQPDKGKRQVVLTAHLTNAVNTPDMVELNLIVDKAELAS